MSWLVKVKYQGQRLDTFPFDSWTKARAAATMLIKRGDIEVPDGAVWVLERVTIEKAKS